MEVDENSLSTMDSLMDIAMEETIMKISTPESEQGTSENWRSRSSLKNPAYGRQRISRPMRIVGPIQKHLFHQEIAGDGRVLIEETEF